MLQSSGKSLAYSWEHVSFSYIQIVFLNISFVHIFYKCKNKLCWGGCAHMVCWHNHWLNKIWKIYTKKIKFYEEKMLTWKKFSLLKVPVKLKFTLNQIKACVVHHPFTELWRSRVKFPLSQWPFIICEINLHRSQYIALAKFINILKIQSQKHISPLRTDWHKFVWVL